MIVRVGHKADIGDATAEAIGAVFGLCLVIAVVVSWIAFGDNRSEATEKAKHAVEDSGYSNVVITDSAIILGCDQNDVYRMRWKGTSQHGKEVHGQVCGGWFFKGWTVRLER